MRTTAGGRAPAVELLINTRHVGELIEEGSVNQIREAIENSLAPGSQSFEQALFEMWRRGVIDKDEALASADSASNLLWLMNNSADQDAAEQATPGHVGQVAAATAAARTGDPSFSEIRIHFEENTLG